MKTSRITSIGKLTLAALPCVVLCHAQMLPSSALSKITKAIQRDFSLVDEMRTINVNDEPNDRLDFLVMGAKSAQDPEWAAWRIEIFSVEHGRLSKTWDSDVSARGVEFDNLGTTNINVRRAEHDYDLLIEGCARHECGDGIDGFLLFSGKTKQTYRGKVVAQGAGVPEQPKYDVTFSTNVNGAARETLQDAICRSSAISNKPGLPFVCKAQ